MMEDFDRWTTSEWSAMDEHNEHHREVMGMGVVILTPDYDCVYCREERNERGEP